MGRKLNFGETMMWLRQFFSSVIVFGLGAVVLRYLYNSLLLGVIIGVLGIILGIIYAEWVRKKYGNSAYYNSLYHTEDNKKEE